MEAIGHPTLFWRRKINYSSHKLITFVLIISLFCITMTVLIILGIFAGVLGFLLLTPLYLFISTPESRYEAGLRGLFKVWVETGTNELPHLYFRMLFFKRGIRLQWSQKSPTEKSVKQSFWQRLRRFRFKPGRVVFNRKKAWLVLKLFWKIIRSFRLKQLRLNIDTGDVVRNAQLIPVFSVFYQRSQHIQLSINYTDTNEFILRIENNLGTILLYVIKTFVKHHLKK